MSGSVTVLTWNLQGSHGVDVDVVSRIIGATNADVVALQEVQERQAGRLASTLGHRHRWVFKHWPIRARAEGLAILTPHPITSSRSFVLSKAAFWDWRRRVGLVASIEIEAQRVVAANVHLSPHGDAERRRGEAAKLVEVLRSEPGGEDALIAGDFNGDPEEPTLSDLAEAGWGDAWHDLRPDVDGWTNWSPGSRRGRPADQRIDYVLDPASWRAVDAAIATPGWARVEQADDGDWDSDHWAGLSDHLPLVVTFERDDRQDRG